MSKLLDRLKGAQRARKDKSVLFEALRKAQEEREASRASITAATPASDAASDPVSPAHSPAHVDKRRDARMRAVIALLVVAALLCAAVAWRGTERERPSGLKLDPALDLTRVQPAHDPEKPSPR